MTRTLALAFVALISTGLWAHQSANLSFPRQEPAAVEALSAAAVEKSSDSMTFTARVARVIDGDTIQVVRDGASTRVELAGVDCPESGQPFAADAHKHTTTHALRKDAQFTVTGGKETLQAVVVVTEPSLNEELLALGLA